MIRQPSVSGSFYPGDKNSLWSQLSRLVVPLTPQEKPIGIIAPHAGYMYSGAVAGEIYGRMEIPPTVVILGPNHHGIGAGMALYPDGEWVTPFGRTAINERLAKLIEIHVPQVTRDCTAHRLEHSLEVQLPFLQFIRPDVTIVPLCLGFEGFEGCRSLGEGIARAIREYGDETLVIASSDMTHYQSALSAREKDEVALQEVRTLNAKGLVRVCNDNDISMCGVIPAAVMLVAAVELGASKAEVVRYATSGDVTGDNRQVVAYAAVAVS